MPQRVATIESVAIAFEVVKAIQADVLESGTAILSDTSQPRNHCPNRTARGLPPTVPSIGLWAIRPNNPIIPTPRPSLIPRCRQCDSRSD